MENIYALAHGPEDAPVFFYVGKTSQTVEQRFAQHERGVNDPFDSKPAYEYWRHLGEEVQTHGFARFEWTRVGRVEMSRSTGECFRPVYAVLQK